MLPTFMQSHKSVLPFYHLAKPNLSLREMLTCFLDWKFLNYE